MQDRNPSSMGTEHCWRSFKPGDWSRSINVRDFIVRNVTPYLGDETFLAPSSNANQGGLGEAAAVFSRGAEEGRPRGRRENAHRSCSRTRLATSIATTR